MVIFHSYVNVYQRVTHQKPGWMCGLKAHAVFFLPAMVIGVVYGYLTIFDIYLILVGWD